jgi:hypothetical protein
VRAEALTLRVGLRLQKGVAEVECIIPYMLHYDARRAALASCARSVASRLVWEVDLGETIAWGQWDGKVYRDEWDGKRRGRFIESHQLALWANGTVSDEEGLLGRMRLQLFEGRMGRRGAGKSHGVALVGAIGLGLISEYFIIGVRSLRSSVNIMINRLARR